MGNDVIGIFEGTGRFTLKFLIGKNVQDCVTERTIAHLAGFKKRIDKVIEFSLSNPESEEFKTASETINRNPTAPEFVKVFEPFTRMDVVQIDVRAEAVKKVPRNSHDIK
jgi:hypothetical protein